MFYGNFTFFFKISFITENISLFIKGDVLNIIKLTYICIIVAIETNMLL